MNSSTAIRDRWRHAPVVVLAGEVFRASPWRAAGLGGMVIVAAALPAGLAIVSGVLAGSLTGGSGSTGSAVAAVFAFGSLFLALQLLPALVRVAAESLGRGAHRAVRGRVLAALGRPAGVGHLEDPALADLVSGVNGGLVGSTARDAVVGMANLAIARGGPGLAALVLIAYRWWLPALLLAAYVYAIARVSGGYQRALESSDGTPARMRRALYLKDLLCTPAAGKEMRTFGLTDWVMRHHAEEFRTAIAEVRRDRTGTGRISLASGAAVLVATASTFVLLAVDLMHGRLTIGQFTMFALAASGLVGLASVTPDLLNVAVGGATLRRVRELERHMSECGPAGDVGAPPVFRESIVFERVGFRYPNSEDWVLRELDLTIRAGQALSVVGVNGAGKTTLVKLLCGLYQPTCGRILVDGVDLRTIDPRAWQRGFAALFQDWVRLGLTLRENVLLGAPEWPEDGATLARVARGAGLTDVVTGLPRGWDTVLRREFDGVDLSGGQWQRVGLARALWALAASARVLILDEPTSALDVHGELELFDRVLSAAAGRTIVLISHRFATVRRADRIVVLAAGRVAEQGTHAELMAAGGTYRRMFTTQADRFAEGAVDR